jgi:hypothetical protein
MEVLKFSTIVPVFGVRLDHISMFLSNFEIHLGDVLDNRPTQSPLFLMIRGCYCKKNDLFYQSICHPLRLLKIPQVAILGTCVFLKGLFLLDSCTVPLPAKIAHQITCPGPAPRLLANQERLWTFDLNKSQVRGRYNCVRDIRRSYCQPFCARVCSAGVSSLHLLIKRNCLVKIFLSLVCLFLTLEGL